MKKQKGFGLLEILITLVLLGVGVAGLVALARNMLSAAQEGRRYEVAMRLAESKLDEFRNFNGVANAVSGAAQLVYTNIVSGSLDNLTPPDAGGSYNLSWAVSNEYLASGAWSTINSAAAPYPDRKVIRVTVDWQDNTDTPRTLTLEGAISPTGSLTQSNLSGLLTARENTEIDYTKGSIPDVVTVELGDGNNKETSKPLPHIKGGSSTSRLVQFDTITYQTVGNASTRRAQQDTVTVYCSCKYEGKSSATLTPPGAYLPAMPQYMQSDKVQYWKAGQHENTIKPIGTLDGNANQQETLCDSCCQDHYDVPSSTKFFEYYDPLHIERTSNRNNGIYLDACRFIRIDGFYRPAPDWHLVSLTTFSASFLNDANNLANYQAYVAYVVTEHAKWQKTAFSERTDSSWSIPSSSPAIQSFNAWLAENRAGSTTTALSTIIGTKQLISRGIYVDIMSPSYLNDEVFKSSETEPDLAKIPFQDVNMTLLSEWSSSDSNKGSVTSQPVATIVDPGNNYYGTYSRGVLTAISTTNTGTLPADNPITITARSYKDNFGVVGVSIPPSTDADMVMTSTMQVSIQDQAVAGLHGIIECLQLRQTGSGNGLKNNSDACSATSIGLTVGVNNANVSCQVLDLGNPAKPSYSCNGVPGSSFTLTLSKSGYQVTPASQTFTLPASGISAGGCVMMVDNALLNSSLTPPPAPTPTTTCSTAP